MKNTPPRMKIALLANALPSCGGHHGEKKEMNVTEKKKPFRDYTPHQQKIIKRYYNSGEQLGYQALAELVTEIYLAEGKKLDNLWKKVGAALEKVNLPASRIEHLLSRRDPKLLAEVVRELTG